MERQNRAKQFVPFAALKGYEEALRGKEKIVVPKKELSEDRQEELDQKLRRLPLHQVATIIYFHDQNYIKVTGMVSRLDLSARLIMIVNTKISFDDIFDILF